MKEREKLSQDEIKQMRRASYIKMTAMVGFVAAVIAFTSLSWFTSNKENEANGMGVQVHGGLFELQTSGTASNFSYLLSDDSLGYTAGVEVDSGTYRTNGSNTRLAIMLSSDNDPMNIGLQPGKSGTVSFTIVPDSFYDDDTEHQLKVEYTISLKGYYLDPEKKEAVMIYDELIASGETPSAAQTADAAITFDDLHLIDNLSPGSGNNDYLAARAFVNGHILFFDQHEEGKYSDLIDFSEPGEKLVDFGSTETVNIHWIWPETFGEIVDASDTVIDSAYYDDMIDYIADHENFFFCNLNKSKITGLSNNQLTDIALQNEDNYVPFSYGYNNADQVIGDNIQFLLIEISANGTIVEKE